MFYNFSPELPQPFNVIHPIQLQAIRELLDSKIPEQVERIYLFGGSLDLSCDKFSDIDLYVLSDADNREMYRQIHNICKKIRKPFDILVSSAEEFIENANELNTVEQEVMKGGVCIYAKNKKTDAIGQGKA